MSAVESYVRTDEHGVMRVGATRVMLDPVVAAFDRGDSPGMIIQQYPSLTLEGACGAIRYSLAHREVVDDYLRRQEAAWGAGRARSAATPGPAIERLRRMKSEQGHPG